MEQKQNDSSFPKQTPHAAAVPCYSSKEQQIHHLVSRKSLNNFANKNLAHSIFSINGNKIIYLVNYTNDKTKNKCGIFEYDIETDTHKTIVLWVTTNFCPSGCKSIYNPTQNEIYFVGGYNYNPQIHQHPYVTIYNIANNKLSQNVINIGSNNLHNANLALTHNNTHLYIVGGQNNDYDIIVNLLTKQIHKNKNNIYPFKDKNYDYGITNHELIYHKSTNQLMLVGGCASTHHHDAACEQNMPDYNKYFGFWTYDLTNGINSTWEQHTKAKQIKYQQFTAVLYDNRIIIAIGGRVYASWEDRNNVFNGQLNDIYYLDLYGDNEWKEAKVKCPKAGKCNAIIIDNKFLHIVPCMNYSEHFYIKIRDLLPETLLNKNDKMELKEEIKSNDEKKDDGLKNDLKCLTDKINEFNNKYDKNILVKMYNLNPDSLFVEQDINNTVLSCKLLEKHLQDIKGYVISVTKPDVNKYKTWNINTMIMWIKSLENGRFIKYCEVLRKGFESDGITAKDLPDINRADLTAEPFHIRSFGDRKSLVEYFKSLVENVNVEGGNITDDIL